MTQTTPRIAPLPEADWSPEARELLARPTPDGRDQRRSNFLTTMAHHPGLFRRWAALSVRLLHKGTIPARERELAILRTGWRCQGGFEWGQHVAMARSIGITGEEIERVVAGPDAPGWDRLEAAILRGVDELHDAGTISDATWAELAQRWTVPQLLEFPVLVGNYHTVAWVQNSIGVALDPGAQGLEAR